MLVWDVALACCCLVDDFLLPEPVIDWYSQPMVLRDFLGVASLLLLLLLLLLDILAVTLCLCATCCTLIVCCTVLLT